MASGFVKIARGVLLAVAGLYLLAFVGVAALRVGYPFELEWMEGGMLGQVRWLLAGHRLYGPPSVGFVPFIYMPLYTYVSAAACAVAGMGFLPMRLVSVAATLGSLGLIHRLVSLETGSRFAGAMAAGLFAATFGVSDFWFDLARVDMLFLVLVLGAVSLVRVGGSAWSAVAAGVVLALAFLTKQTAAVVSVPLMAYALAAQWRRGLALTVTTVGLASASVVVLDALHDGWLGFYVFTVPASHRLRWAMLAGFWTGDVLAPLSVAFVLGLAYVGGEAVSGERRRALFYGLVGAGALAASWVGRMKAGGDVNASIPAHAALAVAFGLGLHRLVTLQRVSAYGRRVGRELVVYAACLVQLGLLAYDPRPQVPTRADRQAGDALEAHGYLAVRAGRPPTAHAMAVRDLLEPGTGPGEALRREWVGAIRGRRFAAILCDRLAFGFEEPIEEHYALHERLFDDPGIFVPVTGLKVRPEILLVPRRDSEEAEPQASTTLPSAATRREGNAGPDMSPSGFGGPSPIEERAAGTSLPMSAANPTGAWVWYAWPDVFFAERKVLHVCGTEGEEDGHP